MRLRANDFIKQRPHMQYDLEPKALKVITNVSEIQFLL